MQNQPKRHHYIPQFFLKNFSMDGNNLWVFDRVKKEFRHQSIRKIASENKLYSYEVNDKEENLEDIFSKVESLTRPILDKITSKQEISGQEKADFAMFVAMLYVRIPDFKKRTEESAEKQYKEMAKAAFSNEETVKKMMERSDKRLSKKEVEELMKFATDGNRYYVKFPSNYWLYSMLMSGLEFARLFIDMNWKFLYFDKAYALVTSDNPVVLVPPRGYDFSKGFGLVTPGARKAIVLTSNLSLVIGDLSKNPFVVYQAIQNKEVFRGINDLTARNSDRFIYSPDKGKLEKLVKDTKVDTYLKETKSHS